MSYPIVPLSTSTIYQHVETLPEDSLFDNLIRELRRLEGAHRIPVSIQTDDEGYLDRECPSSNCLFQFKVHEDDWRDKVRDEEVFCPSCGHADDAGKWLSQEQAKHLEKVGTAYVQQRLSRAMKRDAERWNRHQPRSSFVRITMKVNNRPQFVLLPPAAIEPMRLKLRCPKCECRHAVIGAAFFCPACGHNSAVLVFDLTISGITGTLDGLSKLRSVVEDRDEYQVINRQLVENTLLNLVTAFQRYASALYARIPNAPASRRNAFQSLDEGSDLWYADTGKRYSDYLEPAEQGLLVRAFQQRHLIAHTQGFVDADYILRSGDSTYQLGQRLVVQESAVREYVALVKKLAACMASDTRDNK